MKKSTLERNLIIYPFYRAFSYDFLFIWTISIMYLTFKGLSYSQAILLDSIFMLSAFLTQIPMSHLIKKLGRGFMIRVGSIMCVIFGVLFLAGNNFWWFVLANVFYGVSAAIKNVADSETLSMTLKKLNRVNEYSKYEGKGTFLHYVFESISAILSGYFYVYISPYAPIVCTLVCSIILLLLSCLLHPPKDSNLIDELAESKPKLQAKIKGGNDKKIHIGELNMHPLTLNAVVTKIEDKPDAKKPHEASYKDMLKDKFIISMMVFCFCYYGIMSVYSSLAKIYYQDIGTKAWMFGYIFFVFKIVTALCSKYQFKYELKRGVKSLIIFAILTIFSFSMNGILASINPSAIISIIIISAMFILQNAIRAPYRIFVQNYLTISCEKTNLTKALTLYSMAECLGYAAVTFLASLILEWTNNSFATTNLVLTAFIVIPLIVSIVIFIKELIRKYTKKHTIIRDDMKDDL